MYNKKMQNLASQLGLFSKQKIKKDNFCESGVSNTNNAVIRSISDKLLEKKKQEDDKIYSGILSRIKHLL